MCQSELICFLSILHWHFYLWPFPNVNMSFSPVFFALNSIVFISLYNIQIRWHTSFEYPFYSFPIFFYLQNMHTFFFVVAWKQATFLLTRCSCPTCSYKYERYFACIQAKNCLVTPNWCSDDTCKQSKANAVGQMFKLIFKKNW